MTDQKYNVTIQRRAPLPAEEAISAFEKLHQIRLPDPYRNFLLTVNPISIEESLFHVGNKIFHVHDFYPFDISHELSLQATFPYMNEVFQSQYLAFANDAGNWQFVISLRDEDYGFVFFSRMDDYPPTSLTFLAKGFSEFINGLTVEPSTPV